MRTRNMLVVAGLVAGLAVAGSTAASAHVVGNPTPYPTPSVTQPTPLPTCPLIVRGQPQPLPTVLTPAFLLQVQRFCRGVGQQDIHITLDNTRRAGVVTATGPIFVRFGSDRSVNAGLDIVSQRRFNFRFGSVNIFHPALQNATVDRRACTVEVNDRDQTAIVRGGTGIYRNALGVLTYNLDGIWSFPTRGFRCTLPVGITPLQAVNALNHGGLGLPRPDGYTVGVDATGWTTLLRQLSPHPSYFTPPVSPTGVPA